MKKWNELSGNEKVMLGIVLVLILGIALNWSRVQQGIMSGIKNLQKKEMPEKSE